MADLMSTWLKMAADVAGSWRRCGRLRGAGRPAKAASLLGRFTEFLFSSRQGMERLKGPERTGAMEALLKGFKRLRIYPCVFFKPARRGFLSCRGAGPSA